MSNSTYENILLTQHSVIEASAGTGKTYSLVRLVLRYLTEGENPLLINELVLVTFTNAAAAELKVRLRNLLKEQVVLLSLEPSSNSTAIKRLKTALHHFDEATIGTIHSFCQKIINNSSFENGGLTINELGRHSSWKEELVRDFFRKEESSFSPLMIASYIAFASIRGYEMAAIVKDLLSFIDHDYSLSESKPSVGEQDNLIAMMQAFDAQHGHLYDSLHALLPLLSEVPPTDILIKIGKQSTKLTSALADDTIAQQLLSCSSCFDLLNLITQSDNKLDSMADDLIKFATYKENQSTLTNNEVNALEAIIALYDALEPLIYDDQSKNRAYEAALCSYFVRTVVPSLTDLINKKQIINGSFSFYDLIFRVKTLLLEPHSAMLKKLRVSYRVALIDEFQDTDDSQWLIFKTIFKEPTHQLLLIGDPKQSIYSFRGINSASYQSAIAIAKPSNRHHLGTSYRSRPGLVKAVNYWFSRLYHLHHSITYSNLSYLNESISVEINGNEQAICFIDAMPQDNDRLAEKRGLPATRAYILSQFSKKIAELLLDDQSMIASSSGDRRRIRASDIAFLCRKNSDAQALKDLLTQLNIASVLYKSSSVFKSDEAQWLLLFLEVLALPHNESLAKSLLISPLFGSNIQLAVDDDLSSYYSELGSYRLLANNNQWTLLFQRLMSYSGYFISLLACDDDDRERRYVNMNHLFDSIINLSRPSACSAKHLYRHLKRLVDQPSTDEENIRLERDDDAVHLLTIHGSKGLEYPIVFLFHGFYTFTADRDKFYSIKTSGSHYLDFKRLLHHQEAIRQGYYDEEKNLFYVGATRAKSLLFLPLSTSNRCFYTDFLIDLIGEDSLRLGSEQGKAYHSVSKADYKKYQKKLGLRVSDAEWESLPLRLYQGVKDFISSHQESGFTLCDSLPDREEHYRLAHDEAPTLSLNVIKNRRDFYQEIEKISSYSGLWQHDKSMSGDINEKIKLGQSDEPFLNDEEHTTEGDGHDVVLSALTVQGGSDFGLLLHSLFENIDFNLANQSFSSFACNAQVSTLVRSYASKYFNHAWAFKHSPLLLDILWQTLQQPIMALGGLRLSLIKKEEKKHELEFLIPIKKSSFITLNTFKGYLKHGYLKGFIDLVFIHRGLYYIVDWKTTSLGHTFSEYEGEVMEEAMIKHGYQLQYYLYLYALERYGKSLDKAFNYQDNIGGVLYYFNRATSVSHNDDTAIFYDKPSYIDYQNFINQLN